MMLPMIARKVLRGPKTKELCRHEAPQKMLQHKIRENPFLILQQRILFFNPTTPSLPPFLFSKATTLPHFTIIICLLKPKNNKLLLKLIRFC
ncbi:F5O11.10 isoform [Arachis hypogaea]|nr:F5O11.10 isoform [Arachis hypogaea]